MDEIKRKKKEIFDNFDEKYKGKINWAELKDCKTWNKIYGKIDEIYKCASDYCLSKDSDLNELKKLKEESQKEESIKKDEFIKKLERIFDSENDTLKKFLTIELLWRDRELTEEIAPEIIEDFDCVTAKEGKIHIVVSLPLGPFFEGEEEFQKFRLREGWKNYIDYIESEERPKGPLYQNGIFTTDEEERKLEKECYDIKAFRGITYNEILTPIYKLEISNFCGIIQSAIDYIDSTHSENLDDQKREFFKCILRRVQELLTGWDIKVRLTKGGLVNIFFEKDFPAKNQTSQDYYNIKEFADKKTNLMINPYSEYGLEDLKLLKREQVFTSYLNAAAIWITHIFLKNHTHIFLENRNLVQEIPPRILKRINYIKEYISGNLKYPWDVGYKAFHTEDTLRPDIPLPPLRNYCITFLLKDVEGRAWGCNKPLPSRVHFDCPGDIFKCEKRREGRDGCFIRYLGHSLLALSTNTYIVKEDNNDPGKRPWFTQKEIENLAKRDLSRWRGELCFVDSETILICAPSEIKYINKEGLKIEYDDYWKSISSVVKWRPDKSSPIYSCQASKSL